MKKFKFKIPIWKLYLYDFVERFKYYRRINQGMYSPLFKIKASEGNIIKNTLIKFGKGGVVQRENKFQILMEYLKLVETNYYRVSLVDVKIAHKISPIKKIGETIMSELLKIKKFAKEVGLGFSDTKNLDEEGLVAKIVENIDAKGNYSKDFLKWYEKLEENYPSLFDSNGDKAEEVDMDTIVDAIENADDIDELKEVLEIEIFAEAKKKLSKIKELEELQEKMMEVIQESASDDEKKKGSDEVPEELVEAINEASEVDELKEICQSDEYKEFFSDISMRGRQKIENLKAKMLSALGIESETGPSADELEAELNEMSDVDLKKKAKELDIKAPALMTKKKKEELIAEIIEKCASCAAPEKEEEAEITPSMVKKAVLAKDLDTLHAMCEAIGYKPKILEKKNSKVLGEKILEAISESAPKEKKDKKDKKEKVNIYSAIEALVKEGKKSFAIIKEVTPLFEALGQDDKDFIKEKVKAMIEIAEMEQ